MRYQDSGTLAGMDTRFLATGRPTRGAVLVLWVVLGEL